MKILTKAPSRRLHGRRGLKCTLGIRAATATSSPPSRAAWIEISEYLKFLSIIPRRRPHGRRGLKSFDAYNYTVFARRRLHGRRGLKYFCEHFVIGKIASPPSRAAWIEIWFVSLNRLKCGVSPPSRAAWIEILPFGITMTGAVVAAFTGGVD